MDKTIEEQIADKEQEIVKLKEELARLQTPFVEFPKWIAGANRTVQNAEEEAAVRAGLEAGSVVPADSAEHKQEVKRVEKAQENNEESDPDDVDPDAKDPDDSVAEHELAAPAGKKDASKSKKGR